MKTLLLLIVIVLATTHFSYEKELTYQKGSSVTFHLTRPCNTPVITLRPGCHLRGVDLTFEGKKGKSLEVRNTVSSVRVRSWTDSNCNGTASSFSDYADNNCYYYVPKPVLTFGEEQCNGVRTN